MKTLEPKLNLRKKQIIEETLHFLVKQGRRSEGEVLCLYRKNKNNACAVGCWMDDSLTDIHSIRKNVQGVAYDIARLSEKSNKVIQLEKFLNKNMKVLSFLQQFHDWTANFKNFSAFEKSWNDTGTPHYYKFKIPAEWEKDWKTGNK